MSTSDDDEHPPVFERVDSTIRPWTAQSEAESQEPFGILATPPATPPSRPNSRPSSNHRVRKWTPLTTPEHLPVWTCKNCLKLVKHTTSCTSCGRSNPDPNDPKTRSTWHRESPTPVEPSPCGRKINMWMPAPTEQSLKTSLKHQRNESDTNVPGLLLRRLGGCAYRLPPSLPPMSPHHERIQENSNLTTSLSPGWYTSRTTQHLARAEMKHDTPRVCKESGTHSPRSPRTKLLRQSHQKPPSVLPNISNALETLKKSHSSLPSVGTKNTKSKHSTSQQAILGNPAIETLLADPVKPFKCDPNPPKPITAPLKMRRSRPSSMESSPTKAYLSIRTRRIRNPISLPCSITPTVSTITYSTMSVTPAIAA